MRQLIDKIISKDFKAAEYSLREELSKIAALKLEEMKKNEGAKVPDRNPPFEPDVKAHKKPLKKDRPELKASTKIVKDVVKEAIVQRDGLVHLNTGENILPSIYRQRRGLTEASGNKAEIADSIISLRDRLPKGHSAHAHLDKAEKALDENEVGAAIRHYEHAYSVFRKASTNDDEDKKKKKKLNEAKKASKAAYAQFWAHNPEQGEKIKKFGKEERAFAGAKKEIKKLKKRELKEDAADDLGGIAANIIDRLQKGAKAAIPEKEKEIDATANQFKEKVPQAVEKAKEILSTLKNQTEPKK